LNSNNAENSSNKGNKKVKIKYFYQNFSIILLKNGNICLKQLIFEKKYIKITICLKIFIIKLNKV